MTTTFAIEARALALDALMCCDIEQKRQLAGALVDTLSIDPEAVWPEPDGLRLSPGRAPKPALVPPSQLKHRSVHTGLGRASLIHALTHIEFNAINLALDVIWRFAGMPQSFYLDWMRVAREEAHHFGLLTARLASLGYHYGDFPAHNGLWEMASKTADDLLARLALVPRTLEARGLDASPPMRDKLAQVGDHDSAEILDVILHDEIGHVAIGNYWYRFVCEQRGLDPLQTYELLAQKYDAPRLRGPFNLDARRQAGFDERELEQLALMQNP